MEKFRIIYLIGGVLFLVVSLIGGAWWELIGGDVSNPALYLGLSPFDLKVELLGSQIIRPSPLMVAIFISERLLAIIGSTTIIAGSLVHRKAWSRRLFNLRPFTMPVGFALMILIGIILMTSLITSFAPSVLQVVPDLKEALIPYSSKYLTINLYPILHVEGSIKVGVISRFTIQFWLALLSGLLCLVGTIMRKGE